VDATALAHLEGGLHGEHGDGGHPDVHLTTTYRNERGIGRLCLFFYKVSLEQLALAGAKWTTLHAPSTAMLESGMPTSSSHFSTRSGASSPLRCMPVGSFRNRRREQEDQSASLELPLLLHSEAPQRTASPDPFITATSSSSSSRRAGKSLTEGGMDSHDGIQKLLAAEQEAQSIVIAARQGARARERETARERESTSPPLP
jgi:hypothetical protein